MNECFLKGFGECKGSISREHYISASILEYLKSKGGFKIGGLAWQAKDTLQSIGVDSLQAKVLCEGHNSGLSPLDSSAAKLFQTLDLIDKDRSGLPALSSFDGLSIELWFLKVLCGISSGKGFSSSSVPDQWKEILTGQSWPNCWGLYVFPPSGKQIFTADFLIETKNNPDTGEILAAQFNFAGVVINLLLGTPDKPESFGIYRPRGLIFIHGHEEHRVEFVWSAISDRAVVYNWVGSTKNGPSHREGWDE